MKNHYDDCDEARGKRIDVARVKMRSISHWEYMYKGMMKFFFKNIYAIEAIYSIKVH